MADSLAFDSLDAHLAHAPDIGAASAPMGLMMAWCVQMQLLAPATQAAHENLVLRIRYREALGSDLLMACGGALAVELFSAAGRSFLADYYPRYLEDLRSIFGEDIYAVEDNWDNYARIAPLITRAYMARRTETDGLVRRVSASLRNIWRRR